jgi:uncharacterized membrane protein
MSLVLAVVAVVVGVLLVRQYPEQTENTLRWLLTIRRYAFGALLLMAAVVLLGTGSFLYMLGGFAIIVLATVYLLSEKPYKEAKQWLTS